MKDLVDQIQKLDEDIPRTMLKDRFRFRNRLRSIKQARKAGKPFDRNLKRLKEDVRKSLDLRKRRAESVPQTRYDAELPINQCHDEILEAIQNHQVVVICGETGSGKSTQIPKLLLNAERGIVGTIGHTQPRRIAARSVATRIAEELQVPLGQQVGFQVRFTDKTKAETLIKLMTDGILLTETQRDRFLNQYDTIIIDEAHERSLNIDFLLGYIKRLLPKRPELKLIITSATINAERFQEHFVTEEAPVPILHVSGRTYPVEVRYRPRLGEDGEEELDIQQAVCEAVTEICNEDRSGTPGDILIFLPTEREIRETGKTLSGWTIPGDGPGRQTEIVSLYGRMSASEQQKIFQPHSHRRIVLATNVAESSITVPGIHFVIDTGTARISRYSAHSKVQRLPVEAISRASADQRKGRCGRLGPGVCLRLYSEEDFESREAFTPPELQRTNLASVVLQTSKLKLGRIEDFPFLDPPKPVAIRDGLKTLFEIGAFDKNYELTEIGRQLGRLPVDPRIGRMILAGHEENCLRDILIIAAALEIQDPRNRPLEKQQAADEAHAQFIDEDSDFISFLNLWDFYHALQKKLSRNQLRKACLQNFLSYNRLREWVDVFRQLREQGENIGLKPGSRTENYEAIHRALLTGLLSNIALRSDNQEYNGAGGKKLSMWPGSGLFKKKPKWIVAAELVETSKRYSRTVARINPDWIEPLAKHLIAKSTSDPFWSAEMGAAMTWEKVTLYGIPIVPRRSTHYGKIDRERSRTMFIQHALVERDFECEESFLQKNEALLEELQELQAKSRRTDIVPGEESRFLFYDRRIPDDVIDANHFQKWYRKLKKTHPQILIMTKEDFLDDAHEIVDKQEFPDSLQVGTLELPLEYRLDRGTDDDGITITIPREAVNQLNVQRLGWLVPGLLEEKIVALIKSLPKSHRRYLVPAPETARQIIPKLSFGEGDLLSQVAVQLSQFTHERIKVEEFQLEKLPKHLRMNVHVIDAEGTTVGKSRDLKVLKQELSASATDAFSELAANEWNRNGLKEWDFHTFPEYVNIEHHQMSLKGYPAFIDQQDSVGVRLFDQADLAERESKKGLRRFFYLKHLQKIREQLRWFPDLEKLKLVAMPMGGFQQFEAQLEILLADRAMFGSKQPFPRTQREYQDRMTFARQKLGIAVQDLAAIIPTVMKTIHRTKEQLKEAKAERWNVPVGDMKSQLATLTQHQFLIETPWEWLHQYPRYCQGIQYRLNKLRQGALKRDAQNHQLFHQRWKQYTEHKAKLDELQLVDLRLEYYRWMLEEYRVSLFAQSLGTAIPISEKRLEAQWKRVTPL